jgi:hypothetical protein
MEWVVGIGIALFLFVRFPRQMLIVSAAVFLIGGVIFGGITYYENRRVEEAQRLRDSVVITASFDAGRCTPEFPILTRIFNRNTETLLEVSFGLAGFRDGYSQPVYQGFSFNSDRITKPDEYHEYCWSVPGVYGISNPPPPESMIWRATVSYPTFGTPP